MCVCACVCLCVLLDICTLKAAHFLSLTQSRLALAWDCCRSWCLLSHSFTHLMLLISAGQVIIKCTHCEQYGSSQGVTCVCTSMHKVMWFLALQLRRKMKKEGKKLSQDLEKVCLSLLYLVPPSFLHLSNLILFLFFSLFNICVNIWIYKYMYSIYNM